MSYEIEIKARIGEDFLGGVKQALASFPGARTVGNIDKKDTYFALHENDYPLIRVRLRSIEGKKDVIVTAKPMRSYEGTEVNKELEFSLSAEEEQTIQDFFKSLGYVVCLSKIKTGWACTVPFEGFDIYCELIKVNDLGHFLEAEITSVKSGEDEATISKAQIALGKLMEALGVKPSAIEPKPYRTLILEARFSKKQ